MQPSEKIYGQTVINIDPVLRRIATCADAGHPTTQQQGDGPPRLGEDRAICLGEWTRSGRDRADRGARASDGERRLNNRRPAGIKE